MIEAGKELTQRLDNLGIDITAAFWFYVVDASEWRLVFASPKVDTDGQRAVYTDIQDALSKDPEKVPGLSMRNITVLRPNDPIIRVLLKVFPTQKTINGIRATRNRFNNVFIEDAYIYRMT